MATVNFSTLWWRMLPLPSSLKYSAQFPDPSILILISHHLPGCTLISILLCSVSTSLLLLQLPLPCAHRPLSLNTVKWWIPIS